MFGGLSEKYYENTGLLLPRKVITDLLRKIKKGELFSNLLKYFYRVELHNFRNEYGDYVDITLKENDEFWKLKRNSFSKILKINQTLQSLYDETDKEQVS